MQYREIKRLNAKISTFGMGCMRLPLQSDAGGDASRIDEAQAIRMIHYAIDQGVNYLDSAYVYHGGQSEVIMGKALKMGNYRSRTLIATKLPAMLLAYKRYEEFKADPAGVVEKALDEQLQRLMTDHIDVYLIHNLEKVRWPRLKEAGILDILQRMREKGKIRYIGFSFHDELALFKSIIDEFDWDMCQIQFNILDVNYQAGLAGLKYAGSKGIPVVVMEPLRGGSLVNHIPEDILAVWNSHTVARSPVDWCFRWICNFPEVAAVLSGVSNMEQTKQNAAMFDDMLPNSMSAAELAIAARVQEMYRSRIRVPCTGCAYCMPCPSGVDIPRIFSIYNNTSIFNQRERGAKEYSSLTAKSADASRCVQCGHCEEECPQHIPVIEKLRDSAEFLTE